MAKDTQVTRRSALAVGAGTLSFTLTGCFGRRSDVSAVRRALQAAVESVPEYVRGEVQYQDGFSPGTFIAGNITVDTATRDQTAQVLERIHEAVIRAYVEQPHVRESSVRLRVHPSGDELDVVESAEVAAPSNGTTVTTDDLVEQYGLR